MQGSLGSLSSLLAFKAGHPCKLGQQVGKTRVTAWISSTMALCQVLLAYSHVWITDNLAVSTCSDRLVCAGATTQGLRNSQGSHEFSNPVEIASASDYAAALEGAEISLGVQQRAEAIWRDTLSAASEVCGTVPDSARGDLLHEVIHLVESPTVLRGGFTSDFLKLPRSAPRPSCMFFSRHEADAPR